LRTGLRIVGCVAYKDEFKNIHHTRFCFRTDVPMTNSSINTPFVVCPINEYAD
jgi:hypothetical protein